MQDTPLRRVMTSAEWCVYFQANARRRRPIPWELGADASQQQIAEIADSLRGWQLGETSDGSHLIAAATQYARSTGDDEFLEAARLFIREEQRHGADLGRFLELAGVERATFDIGDWLFRSVRYFLPMMEVWATPVLMVETHAMIYYNAIRRATDSRVLQAICRQILADEVPHLRFQCERLAILHRRRSGGRLGLTYLVQRCLFLTITLAIWTGHRRALRAGGYGFVSYWRSAWGRMRRNWRWTSPAAYDWTADPAAAMSPTASPRGVSLRP